MVKSHRVCTHLLSDEPAGRLPHSLRTGPAGFGPALVGSKWIFEQICPVTPSAAEGAAVRVIGGAVAASLETEVLRCGALVETEVAVLAEQEASAKAPDKEAEMEEEGGGEQEQEQEDDGSPASSQEY